MIFVIDRPGWPNALPAPAGTTFPGVTGVRSQADATDVVLRASFAEWVIARDPGRGIPWTRLELPPLRSGAPRRFIFWHTITWLTRDGSGRWVLDPARSEIARGSISGAAMRSAP
jgi:hypothetical protein